MQANLARAGKIQPAKDRQIHPTLGYAPAEPLETRIQCKLYGFLKLAFLS